VEEVGLSGDRGEQGARQCLGLEVACQDVEEEVGVAMWAVAVGAGEVPVAR